MRLGVSSAVVGTEVVPGDVEVREGTITAYGLSGGQGTGIAVPGFVDVHVHGHAGVDFVDASLDDHRHIARRITSTGVTSYNPTLMATPIDQLVAALGRHPGSVDNGAAVLGFHLEGPFLSPAKPGAQRPDSLVEPEPATIERLLAAGPVDHITLAPELTGGMEAIEVLAKARVVVSLGHSVANARQTHQALDLGATAFTHVFNAMQPLNHRNPGMVGVALSRDDVYLTAIFDGVHLSEEAARIVIRSAGARLIAITDGTSAINSPGDSVVLGDTEVEIIGGAPRLPDGTIAGSILTMDQAFRNLLELGLDLPDVVSATSTTPAVLARLESAGQLDVGSQADIVVLDDRYEVVRTLVGGEVVYPA